MSEEYTIETRRRSRSKTPFLRSNCDHETCEHAGEEGHVHHHQHLKKKAPNVQTIIEETVEVTSSSSAAKATAPVTAKLMQQKTKTSDYSSDDVSPENKIKRSTITTAIDNKSQQQQSAFSSSTSTTTTIVTRKIGGGGGTVGSVSAAAVTSTPKGNYSQTVESFSKQFSSTGSRAANSAGRAATAATAVTAEEMTQNQINAEYERLRKGAATTASANNKSKYKTLNRIFGNSFSSSANASATAADYDSNGDISDHIAYLEYKRAGEYWKKTPKTDYTYSELSPHRRVLAPGIIAMPNMSRRSLENHHERINYMIEQDPAQEEFIRRRYESSRYAQNQRESMKLLYDSGDEIDHSNYDYVTKKNYYYTGGKQHEQELSWFMRIITTIVTSCSNVWTTISGGADSDGVGVDAYNSALYRTKYTKVERGFFGSIFHGISSIFLSGFRYLYMLISSILCFDTWLLQSSNAESRGKKRFLLLLLLLVPLLLLAGLYYYLHPNEPFPPKSFSEITFTLPTLPKIDMSAYLNQLKYDEYRLQAYNRWSDFRDWTDDYLLYLRTVSQNIADEGRKLFRREEHFERV